MSRILAALLVMILAQHALAIDRGSWGNTDISKWFESLRQPDQPGVSCCGEADAYWADSYEVTPNGEYVAIITDERVVEGRKPIPSGTRVTIPKKKITFKQSNPTGHGIVFINPYFEDSVDPAHVYCYLPPGGV